MRKLTKEQSKTKQELVTRLAEAHDELGVAVDRFREEMEEQWEQIVTPKVEVYNQAIADAEGFKSDIVSAQEEYVGGRSDKWQESDAASTYEDWANEWSGLDFSDADLEKPEVEGFSDDNPGEALEQARDEVDG